MDTCFLPNRSRGIDVIDTLEKKQCEVFLVLSSSSYRLKSSLTYPPIH